LSFWTRDRIDDVRAGFQRLADLAADADGAAHRPVPDLHPTAFTDQFVVLLTEAFRAGIDRDRLDPVLAALDAVR
jgi:hypothetical protein